MLSNAIARFAPAPLPAAPAARPHAACRAEAPSARLGQDTFERGPGTDVVKQLLAKLKHGPASKCEGIAPKPPAGEPLEYKIEVGDTLEVPVKAGDTLWSLARKWLGGPEAGPVNATTIGAFVDAIKLENELTGTTIRAGQTLTIPVVADAGRTIRIAIALQRDHVDRTKAGREAPDVDATRLAVGQGPNDTWMVTAPKRDGSGDQVFYVTDGMQRGEGDTGLTIHLASEVPFGDDEG